MQLLYVYFEHLRLIGMPEEVHVPNSNIMPTASRLDLIPRNRIDNELACFGNELECGLMLLSFAIFF